MNAFVARRCAFALATLLTLPTGCSRSPQPCQTPEDCDSNRECLASRCTPIGGVVVSEETRRYALFPERLIAGGVSVGGRAVQLGGPGGVDSLQVEFDLASGIANGRAKVALALLELTSSPLPAGSARERASLRVRMLLDPPKEGLTARASIASADTFLRSATSTRVDVTDLVRSWLEAPAQRHGFVVTPEDNSSILLETGVSGAGPRLDVYVRHRSVE